MTDRQKRKRHAERTAIWRDRVRTRPESRVVDRVMIEALTVALADPALVPPDVATAVMRRVVDLAMPGLVRLGYDDGPSRRALAVRVREHARHTRGSAVRPAMLDVETTGAVRRVRERSRPA